MRRGAFFIATGTHCGAFNETRVAHRMTGLKKPGVGIGRGVCGMQWFLGWLGLSYRGMQNMEPYPSILCQMVPRGRVG